LFSFSFVNFDNINQCKIIIYFHCFSYSLSAESTTVGPNGASSSVI